jgi:hypothetical protein
MAESDKTGIGQMVNDMLGFFFGKQAEKLQEFERECIERDKKADKERFDGFHSLMEKDEAARMTYLTRAWLIDHGWVPTNNYPLFQGDPDCIDADLCVVVDRKDYIIAKFHYMGDKAWEPSAMPDSFELVGVNNSCDLLEYDHTRLVMAAYVCHLTGFEQIDNAIGGVYEMTMNLK